MTLISVIVPVYNAASYLPRCVDSILRQEGVDLELVLVDDGSTDGSAQLCDRYAQTDARVRTVHQQNMGVSAARNAGLRLSRGELIMFVDSDDCMLPGMCALLHGRMQALSADLVVCGTTETGGGTWMPDRDAFYASRTAFDADFPAWLKTELLGPPWNKLYRKRLMGHCFPEDVTFGEDLIFNLGYILSAQRIAFLHCAPFYHEKQHTGQLVSRYDGKKLHDIEAMQRMIQYYCVEAGIRIPVHKYLRDLLVYSKGMLRSDRLSVREKVQAMRRWRATRPYLRHIQVRLAHCSRRDKLYLWLLQIICS